MTQQALFLRLAAPVQTWGTERITSSRVPSSNIPTRSAIEGMLAGCMGTRRDQARDPRLAELTISGRAERSTRIHEEYQTIGAHDTRYQSRKGLSVLATGPEWSVSKSSTKHTAAVLGPGSGGAHVLRREHLQGSEFLLSVRHRDSGFVRDLEEACANPVFSPYLGRKAATPVFPFLMGVTEADVLVSAPVIRRPEDPWGATSRKVRLFKVESVPMAPGELCEVPVLDQQEWLGWWSAHMSINA